MKYLCTIYGDESQLASATPEQMSEMLEAYGAFGRGGRRRHSRR